MGGAGITTHIFYGESETQSNGVPKIIKQGCGENKFNSSFIRWINVIFPYYWLLSFLEEEFEIKISPDTGR